MFVRSREPHVRVTLAVSALTSLLGLVAPHVAWGQTPQANATRRSLLQQATTASESGNHSRALEIAQQAAQIRMSASLRMFIAEEQAATGHLAAALDNAQTCEHEAQVEPNVTDRASVIARCQTLQRTVGARVAHVVLHVAHVEGGTAGAEVHVGNDSLGAALWDVPYVVDPGDVVVTATQSGHVPFRRALHLSEGQSETVEIQLTAVIEPEAPSRAPPVVTVVRHHPLGSYVVMGVGLAGVVAGGVLAVVRLVALSGCETHTGPTGLEGSCDTVAHQGAANGTAIPLTTIAPATAIVGGVVWLAGGAWYLLGASTTTRNTVAWHPSVAPGWIGIEGAF